MLRVSKYLSAVVWVVLRWHVQSFTNRVELLFTLSVLTVTMLWQRLTLKLVFLVSKYGFATVRFMVRETLLLMLVLALTQVLRVTRATEAVTEAEEITAKVANHVLKKLKSNLIYPI